MSRNGGEPGEARGEFAAELRALNKRIGRGERPRATARGERENGGRREFPSLPPAPFLSSPLRLSRGESIDREALPLLTDPLIVADDDGDRARTRGASRGAGAPVYSNKRC